MMHKTARDAFALVVQARMGCLVGATKEYLIALRHELYEWIARIDKELWRA